MNTKGEWSVVVRSTPPRYCLLLLVAPGAFPRARSAAVSQLHTALAPSGGLCPPLLRSPCAAAALAVLALRRCARALQRGCAALRARPSLLRASPPPLGSDGSPLRFAARALRFRSAAARGPAVPCGPPARAPAAADACPSRSARRAPPLLAGLRALRRPPVVAPPRRRGLRGRACARCARFPDDCARPRPPALFALSCRA